MVYMLKKYRVFLFFLCVTMFMSLSTTWVGYRLQFSAMMSRIFTISIYLPFAIGIIWKLWGDIKNRPKDPVARVYYLFAAYYACVTVYRFINGMEVKENLYYSLVLFGSMALYQQIVNSRIQMGKDEYELNIFLFAVYMIIYRFLYLFVGQKIFPLSPLNVLYNTFSIVLLLPFFIDHIGESGESSKNRRLYSAVSIGILVTVAYSTSRVIFCISVFAVLLLFLANVKNTKKLARMLIITGSSVLIIVLLFTMNVRDMRYSLYREASPLASIIERVIPSPDIDQPPVSTEPGPASPNPDAYFIEVAEAQIQRSDSARTSLLKSGIEQIKINPWFGTGDVVYEESRQVAGMGEYTHKESSHNFVIETLVCYGLIGFIFVGIIFSMIVFNTGVFKKKINCEWCQRISMAAVILCYFAMGFTQPSAYNALICPLFLFVIAYYRNIFNDEEVHIGSEEIDS